MPRSLEPIFKARVAERSADGTVPSRSGECAFRSRWCRRWSELFEVDQYVARGAFGRISHPAQGDFTAPVTPFKLYRTPAVCGAVAPELRRAYPRMSGRGRSRSRREFDGCGAPTWWQEGMNVKIRLHGVRVIDLSMGWAGPLAARHLVDMGAEVIKVESCERFDWWRGWEATRGVDRDSTPPRQSASFNTVNRNKLDVTLDLTSPDGGALLKRLVAIADVVVENYSVGRAAEARASTTPR